MVCPHTCIQQNTYVVFPERKERGGFFFQIQSLIESPAQTYASCQTKQVSRKLHVNFEYRHSFRETGFPKSSPPPPNLPSSLLLVVVVVVVVVGL